jgi:putative zinc finger/helix-turn-helix YgiT family protein
MVEELYSQNIKSGRASLFVDGLLCWHCDTCDSVMTSAAQFESNADALRLAEKKSSAYISLSMLREFREKYAVSQRDAGRLIGAGEAAFGKYESGGRLAAPTAKLIRVALAFPDVAKMLAEEENIEIDVDSGFSGEWQTGRFKFPARPFKSKHSAPCMNDEVFSSVDKTLGWSRSFTMSAL